MKENFSTVNISDICGAVTVRNSVYGQDISVFGVDAKMPYEDIYNKNSLAGAVSKNKIFLGVSLTEYFIKEFLITFRQSVKIPKNRLTFGHNLLT